MLTKDPVACADGFRTLVQLALRHLFGVRYCPRCPDCGNSSRPCTDAFGSNDRKLGRESTSRPPLRGIDDR
ncbi:unnamed protein product, partial [Symbiodinium microadriaticum]